MTVTQPPPSSGDGTQHPGRECSRTCSGVRSPCHWPAVQPWSRHFFGSLICKAGIRHLPGWSPLQAVGSMCRIRTRVYT